MTHRPDVGVGVLALQGGFAAHLEALRRLHVSGVPVRTPGELNGLVGLVLPGGESSTLLHLMAGGMEEAICAFAARGGALFGTCAGAILMASHVIPAQRSLGVIDMTVERNAYGRQLSSFEARLRLYGSSSPGGGRSEAGGPDDGGRDIGRDIDGVFIRAPRITRVGDGVEVLARINGDAVLVRQGPHLAASFHPELTRDTAIHALFVEGLPSGTAEGIRSFTEVRTAEGPG